jgi:hypothetical protein
MNWFRDQVKKGLNLRTYVLLGFLLVMLFWIHSLDQRRQAIRAQNASVSIAPAPPRPAPARLAGHGEARATMTPEGWGSDPFERRVFEGKESAAAMRPVERPAAAAPLPTGLYLQGIMEGPMGRTALINGEIYREGQRVGTREVIQIGRKAVMLLDKGNVTTLTLKGDG